MSRVFKITGKQYNSYLYEGVDWRDNGDGSIDMHINNDRTDAGNLSGKLSVDTRVFGTKDKVMNGDGTMRKSSKSFSELQNDRDAESKFYASFAEWVKNGRQGNFNMNNAPASAVKTVQKWLNGNYSDEELLNKALMAVSRKDMERTTYNSTHDRMERAQPDKNGNIMRYKTGIVPDTNVKFIALYTMNDFNFSDAIKHGKLRQNGNTNSVFGIKDKIKKGQQQEVPLTYDNGNVPNPDVASNFSLSNVQSGHNKQQYGMNGEGGYSSVTQFIDKSIIYAPRALKEEGFIPDFIVSAPSSSKFNDYYCHNLSEKMGKPYVRDFFQRNVVNIRFDNNTDINIMRKDGFNETEIAQFANKIKSEAFGEIAQIISQPVRQFVQANENILSNIPTKYYSRERVDLKEITNCLLKYCYSIVLEDIQSQSGNNAVGNKILLQNFMNNTLKQYRPDYDVKFVIGVIQKWIGSKKRQANVLQDVLGQMRNLTMQYLEQLQTNGYHLNFAKKRFKITNFDQRYRKYLKNVYVVADAQLNKYGQMLSRYQNAKFLIFDEDINSGATLKCAIDALQEKLPESGSNNIICLVNAYSAKGM